jgi:tRNA G46 methylase TrmB
MAKSRVQIIRGRLLNTCNHIIAATPRPLILDSYCGTGMSTAVLAAQYPEALVVGIDQSASRLAKHQVVDHQNYLLLQAEAESFWRCLVEAEMPLAAHWMLYPNPWPKGLTVETPDSRPRCFSPTGQTRRPTRTAQ